MLDSQIGADAAHELREVVLAPVGADTRRHAVHDDHAAQQCDHGLGARGRADAHEKPLAVRADAADERVAPVRAEQVRERGVELVDLVEALDPGHRVAEGGDERGSVLVRVGGRRDEALVLASPALHVALQGAFARHAVRVEVRTERLKERLAAVAGLGELEEERGDVVRELGVGVDGAAPASGGGFGPRFAGLRAVQPPDTGSRRSLRQAPSCVRPIRLMSARVAGVTSTSPAL